MNCELWPLALLWEGGDTPCTNRYALPAAWLCPALTSRWEPVQFSHPIRTAWRAHEWRRYFVVKVPAAGHDRCTHVPFVTSILSSVVSCFTCGGFRHETIMSSPLCACSGLYYSAKMRFCQVSSRRFGPRKARKGREPVWSPGFDIEGLGSTKQRRGWPGGA